MEVSKGDEIKGQFVGAGYSTKKGVLHCNFNGDAPCPTKMTEEQLDAYIVGVIVAQKYSLKKGLELLSEKVNVAVTKELTQIHDMETYEPVDPKTMTYEDRKKALASLLFITEKRKVTSRLGRSQMTANSNLTMGTKSQMGRLQWLQHTA